MIKRSILIVLVASLGLTSCQSMNNEDSGVLAGGVIGGLLGSQFGGGTGQVLATGAGVLLGAYLGGRIGKSMDKTDRHEMEHALETGKTGRSISWKNPDSGNRYSVRPTKTYYRNRRPCREFTTTATISGKREVVRGKACRDSRGHWRMV